VQENQGRERELTKASEWPELPRRVDVDDGRRRKQGGARGQTTVEGLGGSDHPGSLRGTPAQVIKRLRGPEMRRWRRIEAAEQITGGDGVARFR
jgi:hypothetical protein